jgi:hypothetical protein
MNTLIECPSDSVTSLRVPEERRLGVLPRHFNSHLLTVEAAIYHFMRTLAHEYTGGLWAFYELSNGGLYMAPDTPKTFHVQVEGNGFDGVLSADAAGVTVCLFALSHLSFRIRDGRISEHFHLLREFAAGHPEASLIFAAID